MILLQLLDQEAHIFKDKTTAEESLSLSYHKRPNIEIIYKYDTSLRTDIFIKTRKNGIPVYIGSLIIPTIHTKPTHL